jgi:hypothetical protein
MAIRYPVPISLQYIKDEESTISYVGAVTNILCTIIAVVAVAFVSESIIRPPSPGTQATSTVMPPSISTKSFT